MVTDDFRYLSGADIAGLAIALKETPCAPARAGLDSRASARNPRHVAVAQGTMENADEGLVARLTAKACTEPDTVNAHFPERDVGCGDCWDRLAAERG